MLCQTCYTLTHDSQQLLHNVLEYRAGRWRPYSVLVVYPAPITPNSLKSSIPPILRHTTMVAWTMHGSREISFSYWTVQGIPEWKSLFERLHELGFMAATPTSPRK